MPISFNFEQNEVQTLVDEAGNPWFRANDVCEALGFGNPRQAIDSHVDEEDVQKMDALTVGGMQQVNFINESGLYALIFGSKLETAKRFKRWVTSEVLPQIRRTGSFGLGVPGQWPVSLEPGAQTFVKLFYLCQRINRPTYVFLLHRFLELGAAEKWVRVTLRELDTMAGSCISKSGAQRAVEQLSDLGFILRQPKTGFYRLNVDVLSTGIRCIESLHRGDPGMQEFDQAVNEARLPRPTGMDESMSEAILTKMKNILTDKYSRNRLPASKHHQPKVVTH